ncbi:MAG: TolC family protein [Clostridia bacterium]|nr:TolC family protein [Clostridia bacterium]
MITRMFRSGPAGGAAARSWCARTALAVAIVTLMTLVFCAHEGARCAAAQNEPVKLALDEARGRAMGCNYDYSIAKLEFEASEIQFKMAEADALLRPSVVASKRAASARKDAARALVAKEQSLMLEVDKAYYNLVTAQERMGIMRRSEEQTRESLRIVRLKSEAGLASKMDVMSAEIALERAAAETVSAENQLELAQLALKQTLGVDLGMPVVVVDSAQPIAGEVDYEAALARSLKSRPEIVQAREALEIAQLEVGFADNEYTPELTKRQLNNALEQARLAAAKSEQGVRVEVRRMYLSLEESRRAISIASAAAKQAEESYRIMKLRYEHGMEIANSLLGAQLGLTQARLAELQAVMNYNIERLRFDAWTNYPAEDAEPGESS